MIGSQFLNRYPGAEDQLLKPVMLGNDKAQRKKSEIEYTLYPGTKWNRGKVPLKL